MRTVILLCALAALLPVMEACLGIGGCGYCGCGRCASKARGSKTLKIEKKTDLSPDGAFKACCEERGLPDACMDKCSYRTYTSAKLTSMFFRTDACPLQAAADIHECAARSADHTECCRENAVQTTAAGERCLRFCDQRPANATQLDMGYLPCFEKFDHMRSCFWHHAVKETEEYEEE